MTDLEKLIIRTVQKACIGSSGGSSSDGGGTIPPEDLEKLKQEILAGISEVDTLKTVTDRENITDVPIKLRSTKTNPKSGAEKSYTVDLHYSSATSNLMLTNNTETYLQDNGTSTENTMLGIYNLYTMGTLKSNILYGYYPIRNVNGGTTNLTDNIIIGNLNLTKAPALGNNIVIGKGINIGYGNYLTDPDTTYYPIWGDFISGNRTANAWGNIYTGSNHKDWLMSQGIINEEGKSGPFSNIFIGRGIGPNRGSSTPANSYQSIWIGHNSYPADFAYKFCGNIFLGNEIYPAHPHDRPAGAVIIGNYLKISGRYTLGELAIHSSSRAAIDWNDALIRGNFDTRHLKINGKFIINPQYAEPFNSKVFTKQVVAKPDGTTTLVDLPAKPQIKMLKEDYTPTENLEYLDTFTFNLKTNTTYKLEIGILGDGMTLSQCIITNDVGNLSVASRYLVDSTGSWNFHIGTEEELQQMNLLEYGLYSDNKSFLVNCVIRPKSDCYIKIPVKKFTNTPVEAKLLAGTYMKLEPIVEPII